MRTSDSSRRGNARRAIRARFRRARQTLAGVLVVLAALPFTAPFSTCALPSLLASVRGVPPSSAIATSVTVASNETMAPAVAGDLEDYGKDAAVPVAIQAVRTASRPAPTPELERDRPRSASRPALVLRL